MTPEPKPPILTKEQARAWHDVLPWSPISIEKEMEAIAAEKTKVVPVRSAAEWRAIFKAECPVESVNAWMGGIWTLQHLGLVAATRDA